MRGDTDCERKEQEMSQHEQSRVQALWQELKDATEETLRRFAAGDMIRQARLMHTSFYSMSKLRQYARCRAWSLHYRATGQLALARHEAALAGHQARYFSHR